MQTLRQSLKVGMLLASLALICVRPVSAQNAATPPIPDEDELPIALLVDVTSGQVLYSRNPKRRFVPASITKVMTLFLAFELIEEGELDPRQRLVMPAEVAQDWRRKGSTMFLDTGDEARLWQVLTGIANVSANDGSALLAHEAAGSIENWADLMNAKAHSIGMTGSHFGTPNGWPDDGVTFTTASDLVTLGDTMVERHPILFNRFIGLPEFRFNGITQPNHDPLIGRLRGAEGIKTGYTNEAGFGFLGTASRNGQRLMMVVAGAGRASVRNQAARDLMEWGFSSFDRQVLFMEGQSVASARVQGGAMRSVDLVADRVVAINVPGGAENDLHMSVTYDGPLRAPLSAGEQVATLEITGPGIEPAQVPLVARTPVSRAGFFDRIINAIAGWVA